MFRFAQNSHDHRGTELNPGKVVTLVTASDWNQFKRDEPEELNHVWGQIYKIPEEQSIEIWAYLDHREKDGYSMRLVDVFSIKDGVEYLVEKDVSLVPSRR